MIRICLSFDFDAMSSWIAIYRTRSPNALSRGEFGGRVGAPRILDLLAERAVPTTWFVPGHTAEAFPEVTSRIAEEGHEIGHHGYCHENPAKLEPDEERRILVRGIECLQRVAGVTPIGYRCPSGSASPATVSLLCEAGFLYDSSMMGDDFQPYWCRSGDAAPPDGPYEFGQLCPLIQMPFAWHLDDHPFFEHTASRRGINPGLADPERVLRVWCGELEYLERLGSGVLIVTMHPQVIGRGHRMLMLERFLDRLAETGGTFCTLADAATAWQAENPFPGPGAAPA
ncbi:MAG: polysaccharide deacetylase [Thermoanaerobaculia bacterium]|nr:polysaccharide deacetylase [Thermoanaerobaculia bacterium]